MEPSDVKNVLLLISVALEQMILTANLSAKRLRTLGNVSLHLGEISPITLSIMQVRELQNIQTVDPTNADDYYYYDR